MKWIDATWGRVGDTWSYRNEPERFRNLVEVYWRILLGLACILILCTILYSTVQLFSMLSQTESEVVQLPSDGGAPALNRADLRLMLDGFAARETNYESLKKKAPVIADPSR